MMTSLDHFREGNRLEAKKALGGLPRSVWETYSAFANTNGGMILLGVEEMPDKSLRVCGVDDPEKLIKEFWDTVNNPQKVNLNILTDRHVQPEQLDGKTVIRIAVPRAARFDKPIYLGNNPLTGCFRRNGEGDYHCTREDVAAMLRDAAPQNLDLTVVPDFPVSVLNPDSVRRYRRRMANLRPMHSYHSLEDVEFLYQLGAVRRSEDNSLHPTQAGLLMFGNETEIVQVFPHYFLDYQERMDRSARWTDRFISSSGDWSGNLFDFYYRVFQAAAQSLKLPFMLDGIHRKEETPLHVGLREALANCLIHADYHGVRGIVIVREPARLTFSNPGTCRVDPETAKAGGISEPRNETLMKMFNFIDVGERAGSGIFNICQAWKDMGLKAPLLTESFSPDRMEMSLDLTDIEAVVAKLIPSLNPSVNDDPTVNPTVNPPLNDDPTVNPSLNPSLNELNLPEQLKMILAILRDNPKATYSSIAAIMGKNRDTIRLYFQSLIQEYHLIERVGSRKTGYWKILFENFKRAE